MGEGSEQRRPLLLRCGDELDGATVNEQMDLAGGVSAK